MNLKTLKGSIYVLVLMIIVITVTGRMVQVSQDKATMEAWVIRQNDLLKVTEVENQLEKVKNENIILKKQVSLPIREKIIQEIVRVFGSKAKEAIRVAQCESGIREGIVNHNNGGSRDYSVFQINSLWTRLFGEEFKSNWRENIKVAKAIFDRSGDWRMWRASSGCHGLLAENK